MAAHPAAEERTAAAVERFDFGDLYGEVMRRDRPADLEAAIRRAIDSAAAEETVHWGRNYLYRTRFEGPGGRAVPVLVKQFRNHGWRDRLRRRRGEGKAARSWRMARAFEQAGVATASPVALVESRRRDGPSFFLTRYLEGALEARYVLRAARAGTVSEAFPALDFERFLAALGGIIRHMHGAGFFHRDLSIGNVLLVGDELFIVDLNRARRRRRLGLGARTRDLCRLALFARDHQRRLLAAYWGAGGVSRLRAGLYQLYRRAFLVKIEGKKQLRRALGGLGAWLRPRRAHVHIPAPAADAGARDKSVWDALSDQPHQHANRLQKLAVRLADSGSHLRHGAAFAAAAPGIWRRYRALCRALYRQPVPWQGVGVALRPLPEAPEALLEAVDALGVRDLLLRLHPWADDHRAEETLARELYRRGYRLAFSLPQNRDLVRDPRRWCASVEELAARFAPFGRQFQVGQAVNRSKWGVWRYGEYLRLAAAAADILRRHDGVEVLGPAVIDFELHATAALVNLPAAGVRFDALASLLYVDRRGAPENRQLGFDTVNKAVLLKAIAETARCCGPRSFITEVNWPLREGPHAPAGRGVAVGEAAQADYLARFYLLALGTGLVERVYWWQLVARGYGLSVLEAGRLRRRPAFDALATLGRTLADSRFLGPLPAPDGVYLYPFALPDGGELVAVWSPHGVRRVALPRPVVRVLAQDGGELAPALDGTLDATPAVRYAYHE